MNLLNIVLPIIVIILSGLILIIFIPLISFLSGEILCVYIFHNKDGSNAQYRLGINNGKIPSAGKSNSHLFNWISANTHPSAIIAQHGIVLASQSCNNNYNLIEMHPLGIGYVDTYEAVESSLNKIDSLYNKRLINTNILVVAHDMQIQRVLWDIHRISAKNPEWQKFKFIVPEIPKSPFSQKSTQLHTKWRFIYNLVEICYSRPRDYWFK